MTAVALFSCYIEIHKVKRGQGRCLSDPPNCSQTGEMKPLITVVFLEIISLVEYDDSGFMRLW